MNTDVQDLDPAIMEGLRQRGRMPLAELAKNLGVGPSDVKALVMATFKDLSVSDDDVVVKLTPEDEEDYERLERAFSGGQRDSAEALMEIHDRKLFRQDYRTWEEYMTCRWQRTTQWAGQLFAWLRRTKIVERNRKDPFSFRITVDDAQTLARLEDDPDLLVQAIEEAEEDAKRTGKQRSKKHLQAAAKRLADYKSARATMPDLTYDEHKSLSRLGVGRQVNPDLVAMAKNMAQADGRPLVECLLEVCQASQGIPSDQQLLAVARDDDSYAEVLETIRHEIAHAISQWDEERKGIKHDNHYKRYHNDLFYKWCVKVGCKPQRCADGPDRPKHADEKPKYILGCKCIRQYYKRIPPEIRTDETGRAFYYSWVRHEYWDSEERYMEYHMERWVKNNRHVADHLKPCRVEWELQRRYLGCRFHHYKHEAHEQACGKPLYLYHYNEGYGMWYFGNPIPNVKIDDVPLRDACSVSSHYPGEDDEN